MPILVTDPILGARLLAERRACGGDPYDEVWDGLYVISPVADDEHQRLITRLASIFELTIGEPGLGDVRAGVNVSDRVEGWERNYRVPDVVVRLRGGRAEIHEAHWCGGPDFMVEVVSRSDRTRDKLDFYAAIGVRELLLVDRDPWAVELYGLRGDRLVPIGVSRPGSTEVIASGVLPLTFRLVDGGDGPRIEVVHVEDGRRWLI